MMNYDISYDLPQEGQDYSGLIGALRKIGARKYQLSGWFLQSSLSAQQIHDLLSVHVDGNDRLKVAEVNPANMVSTNELNGFSALMELFSAAPLQDRGAIPDDRPVPYGGLIALGSLYGTGKR